MIWRRRTRSADATREAGEAFAKVLRPGDVVLLVGRLGAGKTTFVQGVAKGLGVNERVTSPTFVMVRQHQCAPETGIKTLHHADVYRTESLGEISDLDLGELVEESAVALVEWGDLAAPIFGSDVLRVAFAVEGDERVLVVSGELAHDRLDELSGWGEA